MNSKMQWIFGSALASVALLALGSNGCSGTDTVTKVETLPDGSVILSADAQPYGCPANTKTCASPSLAQVCPADGSGWLSVPCAKDEVCTDGECKANPNATCAAGSGACVDATSALRCKADRAGFEQITCPAGTTCMGDGLCVGSCIVGATICLETGSVATCLDGKTYTQTACNAGELCVETGSTPYPTAACKPAACTPRTDGCDWSCGNRNDLAADHTKFRSRCVATPNGYKWESEGCSPGVTCDPTADECDGEGSAACRSECTPGDMRCASNALGTQTCGADGKWSATVTSCNPTTGTTYVCMPKPDETSKVVCGDPLCADGQQGACTAQGQFRACGNDGRLGAPATCAAGTCVANGSSYLGVNAGACVADCKQGEERCVASGSGNGYQACANGRWGAVQTCANLGDGGLNLCVQYTSSTGLRQKLCGAECAPGTARCANGDGGAGNEGIQTCNAQGQWAATAACNVGACQQIGSSASCVTECIPNSLVCTGNEKNVAGTGYYGSDAFGACSAKGFLPTSSTACAGTTVCRTNPSGFAIVSGQTACLECVGPNVAGGNEYGLVDQRCSSADGSASGWAATQLCGAGNTWTGAATSCANGSCDTDDRVGAACYQLN